MTHSHKFDDRPRTLLNKKYESRLYLVAIHVGFTFEKMNYFLLWLIYLEKNWNKHRPVDTIQFLKLHKNYNQLREVFILGIITILHLVA